MAETPMIPIGFWKTLNLLPLRPDDRGDDKLSDPRTILDHKGLVSEVNQNDLDFSPVIRIDGSR